MTIMGFVHFSVRFSMFVVLRVCFGDAITHIGLETGISVSPALLHCFFLYLGQCDDIIAFLVPFSRASKPVPFCMTFHSHSRTHSVPTSVFPWSFLPGY